MGLNKEEIDKRVKMAAKFAGLDSSLFLKSPFELSGGEKRRTAIAGVIAMDPEVFILDEPTAGLDPRGRDALLQQIVSYHRKRNNTVLFVSHNMEDIAKISDRVLVLDHGEVCMFDDTRTVFSRGKELEKIGLRVPEITKIMMNLKEKGYAVDSGIITVEEGVEQVMKLLKNRGGKL